MGIPIPFFGSFIASVMTLVSDNYTTYLKYFMGLFSMYMLKAHSKVNNLLNTVPTKLKGNLWYIRYYHKGRYNRIIFPIHTFPKFEVVSLEGKFNEEEMMEYFNDSIIGLTPGHFNIDFLGVKYTTDGLGVKVKEFNRDDKIMLD